MCQAESATKCGDCCQTNHASGSTDLFGYVATCLCTAGSAPCATACAAMDDYCGTPGEVTSNKCNTCFDTYVASGATCDPTKGAVATSCNADPECAGYTSCINGCP